MTEATSERGSDRPVAVRGRVVLPDRVIEDGLVAVQVGTIRYAGPVTGAQAVLPDGAIPSAPPVGTTILPGLVDVHCHGGGGASFPDAAEVAAALPGVLEHRRHGTTSMLASLVTAAPQTMLARTAVLAELAAAGEIAGIHAEGPFLSHERRGAQSPDHLLTGDPGLVRELVAAGRGYLRTMTVAPEVPGVSGAGGVAETLVELGVVPSVGHTCADAAQTSAFLTHVSDGLTERAAGGRALRPTATHLFNGMPPLHHRSPGPVAACLAAAASGNLVAELVADGVHLAPELIRAMFDVLGSDNIALVTDAMAAAGLPDGDYQLGPMQVSVAAGVARTTDPAHPEGGSLAGGTAHLLDVVRTCVAAGVPMAAAVKAASLTPAQAVGLSDVGALVAGYRGHVLVTDAGLAPVQVIR